MTATDVVRQVVWEYLRPRLRVCGDYMLVHLYPILRRIRRNGRPSGVTDTELIDMVIAELEYLGAELWQEGPLKRSKQGALREVRSRRVYMLPAIPDHLMPEAR